MTISKRLKRSMLFSFILTIPFLPLPCQSKKDIRIISLAPSGTEILAALGLGSLLVARSSACNYPPEVKVLPIAAEFNMQVSPEKILSFSPSFLYLQGGVHDSLVPYYKELGIECYLSTSNSISDLIKEIKELGSIFKIKKTADTLIRKLKQDVEELKTKYATNTPITVYYQIWDNPYMSIGRSFINELISTAGGRSITEKSKAAYPIVSEDAIISKDPAVILLTHHSFYLPLIKNENLQNIKAVKENRVYVLESDCVNRLTLRVTDGIKLIHNLLYKGQK